MDLQLEVAKHLAVAHSHLSGNTYYRVSSDYYWYSLTENERRYLLNIATKIINTVKAQSLSTSECSGDEP